MSRMEETTEHLSPVVARMILVALPKPIRDAFERWAAEIDYPVEAVLEMALAGFLDGEVLSSSDCNASVLEESVQQVMHSKILEAYR